MRFDAWCKTAALAASKVSAVPTICDQVETARGLSHIIPNFPDRHALFREHQRLVLTNGSRRSRLGPERRKRCSVIGCHLRPRTLCGLPVSEGRTSPIG